MEGAPFDVLVIGAGPAGLAAAMFTARRGLRTCVLSKDIGGQAALTDTIENYPGIASVSGRSLVETMRGQATRDGADWQFGEAISIVSDASLHLVRTAEGTTIAARTIILAFGLTPNDLDCLGEAPLRGRGLYYSAVADAPMQDGKTVAVVGGGNAAVTAALELAPRAARVYCIHRREEFRAEQVLLDRLLALPNVVCCRSTVVAEVRGDDRVRELVLAPATDGASRVLAVDSVFVQIGYSAKTNWLDGVVARNARREVMIDRDCQTNAPGIFAAGDITDISYKQAVISAGEGVKAALQAFKYLQTQAGRPAVMFDWEVKTV
ncbi:FAD-dependent oxidoreductase [Candidatus Uhrbacteria bacterium]|nr:FAD-dependent oxidoreductase [Candidatus Uhrbacteria bacterium]